MTREKSDRYQELFERSADASLLIKNNTFLDCNQAAVDLFRYANKDEVRQTHPSELSPATQPDGRASFEKANDMIAIARRHGSHRFEWSHQRKSGEVFPAEVLLTPVDDSDNPLVHAVVRDLSEKWRLEEQLRQSQKMEAIGKLSGGIAHDFNNLLVAILGNCHVIKSNNEDKRTLAAADQILEASERAAALVRQLMSLSRREPRSRRDVDLEQEIGGIAPLLERTLGEHIQIEVECDCDCHVFMDSSQVDQLILNLASNARDAMPNGGTLRITLREVPGSECDLPGKSYAEIAVSDTGVGMSDELARHAFEPFFTTKAPGSGTGFGLATVYGIVDREGGAARIDSKLDQGTTVRLYLPCYEPEAIEDADSEGHEQLGGNETILYVEDDPLIGELLTMELQDRGFIVYHARHGAEGLSVVETLGEQPIDLIVTDVIMPTMSGPRMIQELVARGKSYKTLFVSGYTDSELAALSSGDVELLHKPFTPDDFVARIRKVIDS